MEKPMSDTENAPSDGEGEMSIEDLENGSGVYYTVLNLAAGHEGQEIDPAAEKRPIRKTDHTLLPTVND